MPTSDKVHSPACIVTCSTLAPEVRACCQQLGVLAHLRTNPPVCLFEAAQSGLSELVDGAAQSHDQLLLALGECCIGGGELASRHGAATVRVAACTELLTGRGTYRWCADHGVLLLPPAYLDMWLPRASQDEALEAALAARITDQEFERIAVVNEGTRMAGEEAIAELGVRMGCPTAAIYTGLGHARQALRAVAEDAGMSIFSHGLSPIGPETLGPGDQCLLLSPNGPASNRAKSARLAADSLSRGLTCAWVVGGDSASQLPSGVHWEEDHLQRSQAAGELSVRPGESVVADAEAQTDPARLVDYWVSRAVEALEGGYGGVCIIHGCAWAEAAGLPTEYLLEYSSRLSAACSQWPIVSALEVSPESYSPHIVHELTCTHPLSWDDRGVTATEGFRRTDDYLGGQVLLETLQDGSGEGQCRDLHVLVSSLADGELDRVSCRLVAEHVDGCPACQQFMKASQEIIRMLGSLGKAGTPVPPGLWQRVRATLELDE